MRQLLLSHATSAVCSEELLGNCVRVGALVLVKGEQREGEGERGEREAEGGRESSSSLLVDGQQRERRREREKRGK